MPNAYKTEKEAPYSGPQKWVFGDPG